MKIGSNQFKSLSLAAMAVVASGSAVAQPQDGRASDVVVKGIRPDGPEIKGVISARNGNRMKVTAPDGRTTLIALGDMTRIKAGGGLFGGGRRMGPEALINGLPVDVKTSASGAQAPGELLATQVSFRPSDLRIATMIRSGTSQRFDEQTAATESLRGRMGDIDKYNIKGTTNVHFATGKSDLSAQDKAELCTAASTAEKTDNALLLVVGYTDATGGQDFNQQLSEKRANRVINYLQQACGWKPYRMLTPTGMAKADPVASNDTAQGKAQNRRVAVNILVSKSVDGF
jgi:outer membrane protein OmpA-like peptidoglycan-associated protein